MDTRTRAKIASFTDLIAWQKGHLLVLEIYKATNEFPSSERFGLTAQLNRAAISITSNIAEGFSRQTKADKIHFYHVALGSTTEVQNQTIIAKDLDYLSLDDFKKLDLLSIEVNKLLNGLIKSIRVNQ